MSLSEDRKLVKRVDDHAEGLTEWERDFVESLVERLDEGRELTEKQRKIAGRLDEEKVK